MCNVIYAIWGIISFVRHCFCLSFPLLVLHLFFFIIQLQRFLNLSICGCKKLLFINRMMKVFVRSDWRKKFILFRFFRKRNRLYLLHLSTTLFYISIPTIAFLSFFFVLTFYYNTGGFHMRLSIGVTLYEFYSELF